MKARLETLYCKTGLDLAHKVIAIREGEDIVFVIGSMREKYHVDIFESYKRHHPNLTRENVIGGTEILNASSDGTEQIVIGISTHYGEIPKEKANLFISLLRETYPTHIIHDRINCQD